MFEADALVSWAPLLDKRLIRIGGRDACSFLQGLITQDLFSLGEKAVYGAFLNPQGYVLFTCLVLAHHDALYLEMDHSVITPFFHYLQQQKLRASVTWEVQEGHLSVVWSKLSTLPEKALLFEDSRTSEAGLHVFVPKGDNISLTPSASHGVDCHLLKQDGIKDSSFGLDGPDVASRCQKTNHSAIRDPLEEVQNRDMLSPVCKDRWRSDPLIASVVESYPENSEDFASTDRLADQNRIQDDPLQEPDSSSSEDMHDTDSGRFVSYTIHRWSQGLWDYPEIGLGKTRAWTMSLDWVNGISWNKGCFVGQEVLARYRFSEAKKMMVPCFVSGWSTLPEGSPLCLTEDVRIGTLIRQQGSWGVAELPRETVISILSGQMKVYASEDRHALPLSIPWPYHWPFLFPHSVTQR